MVTAVPGSSSFTLTGGQIAASGNCTISVSVASSIAGNLTNTIQIGAVSSFQGASNTQVAEATLTNLPGLGVSKAFSPSSVSPGGTTRLIITVNNADAIPITGIAFTDTLPAGLTIASTPNNSTTCTAGSTSTTVADISLSGATLTANSSCTVGVDVIVGALGTYINTIPPGGLSSIGGATNATAATASVTAEVLPTVGIGFNPTTIQVGDTSVLTISLGNTSGSALTLVSSFTNTFPANLKVGTTPNIGGTCTTSAVSATPAGNTVSYATGSTLPNGGCTITLNVTSAVTGTYVDTIPIGGLATNGGANENPATATLTVGSTAGTLSITGRVLANTGRPVTNAILLLTDEDGAIRYARTNPFGVYRFTNIEAGSTYVLAVIGKRLIFAPRVLSLTTDLEEYDFIAP
jgi:uncharacterized repeat protein (TIGR01451 family)